jgi:hypothetical protein
VPDPICNRLAVLTTEITLRGVKKTWRLVFCLLALLAVVMLTANGCKTQSGSREFVPGKGWKPV